MYYKFLAPELFGQYEKIMITDVDVVFLGDVSRIFHAFDVSDDAYLMGHGGIGKKSSWLEEYHAKYEKTFSDEELLKLRTAAGFWIFNLRKMREDNIQEKFIKFAEENSHRLKQPEQDTVNIICYPKIKYMPAEGLICSYLYDLFPSEEDYEMCTNLTGDELRKALSNPVQLHYATSNKPWKNPGCTKAEIWFEYLAKTPFLKDYLNKLGTDLARMSNRKDLLEIKIPFSRRNLIVSKTGRVREK